MERTVVLPASEKTGTEKKDDGQDLLSAVYLLAGPLLLIDQEGRVRSLNGAFVRLLGYSAAGVQFRKFCAKERQAASFLQALKRDGRADASFDLVAGNGEKIPARVRGVAAEEGFAVAFEDLRWKKALEEELLGVREELERKTAYQEDFREGVFHMLRDLDSSERELESAYEKLKETQAQLIQSSKMTALGELAAGVAHELNQPLTVIKGLSQNLCKNTDSSNPMYDKLRLIAEASRKMELVIRHLRIFSRTDGPTLSPVDLNRVIRDAYAIVKEILANNSIQVKMHLSEIPAVLGSENRLEQVVINLVTNARDAMPQGGAIEISTGTVKHGPSTLVRMSIKDTGCGIPKSLVGRIFDPFFTTKEIGKGTGLGLSISYGIIKEHRGEITVESEPGAGAVFHVVFPPATADTRP
ncbi:MAG TPA: ATP-binding protein [Thermodesulfobacteriota bacterium]|nr:ATP-binding protein [Thermodesulfobacteriota bacterium]